VKNRGAAISARLIPYHKAYKEFCGSVLATILFEQLEYWTNLYEDGFYKALGPCEKYGWYRTGDSWLEELGFSRYEFKTAFAHIGIAYVSKKQYDRAGLYRFQREDGTEALYCSYIDRPRGKTYYFRNHARVAQLLQQVEQIMFPVELESSSTGRPLSVELDSSFPVELDSGSPGKLDSGSPHDTESTTESTTKNLPLNSLKGAARFSMHGEAKKRAAGAGEQGEGRVSGGKRKRSKLWLKIAAGCDIHPRVSSAGVQIEISRVEAELRRMLGVEESHLLEYCNWVEAYWREQDWRGSRLRAQVLQPHFYIDLYLSVIKWKGKTA